MTATRVSTSVNAAVLCLLALAGGAMQGCQPTREITRVEPDRVVDVDYRFNDTDARAVYQAMVEDALARGWIDRHMQAAGGQRPVVIVGPITNATQDYIDTQMITTSVERELINSGRVRFVAMKDQRGAIREEREQGQEWSRPETRKRMKFELGADYMMIGRIMDDKPRTLSGRGGVSYFKANLEVIDLESNEKVWIGEKELKKVWRDR